MGTAENLGYFILNEEKAYTLEGFSKIVIQLALESMQTNWKYILEHFPTDQMKERISSPMPLSIELLSYNIGIYAFLVMNFCQFPQELFENLKQSLATEVFDITNDEGKRVYDLKYGMQMYTSISEHTIHIWEQLKHGSDVPNMGPGAKVLGNIIRMYKLDGESIDLDLEVLVNFPVALSNSIGEIHKSFIDKYTPRWVVEAA